MSQNYGLLRAKRDWVPEWLWWLAKPFVLWLWPLEEILTAPLEAVLRHEDEADAADEAEAADTPTRGATS